jgi:hypothetical protein
MRSTLYSRLTGWTSLFSLLLGLIVAGGFLLFSTFLPFDDEGYVLVSFRNFSTYGGLYDRVYTQYGPAFFLIGEAIRFTLRVEWTSDAVRALTLLNWIATAICCSLIVVVRTRSKFVGALALTLTFIYLIQNVLEPGHPGSMIALLVSLVALIGSKWDIAKWPAAAAAVGAFGAVVAMIKINVGAFLLIGAVFWILLRSTSGKSGYGRCALYFLLLALPWLLVVSTLMHQSPSVVRFALMSDIAIAGVLAAIEVTPRILVRSSALLAYVVGGLFTTIAVLILILSRGTSLAGLISGVILDPLRHPAVNFSPVRWAPFSLIAAVGALLLAIGYYLRPCSQLLRYGVILGRLLGMAVLLLTSIRPSYMAPAGLSGLSVAALYALPLRWDSSAICDIRCCQWIAVLLVLQSLQAYPIAGSQVSWGTFLIVPLATIAMKDVWDSTAMPLRIMRPIAVCLIAMMTTRIVVGGLKKFNDGEWLGLAGARYLSLPIKSVLRFRTLSENVHVHADQLFSIPGSFSFNLWTGVPTPTLANATLWNKMLSSDAQSAIIARLEDDQQAVIIRRGGEVFNGELGAYIDHNFEPAFGVDDYEFLVHRGRRIAPLSTATVHADPVDPNYLLLTITLAEVRNPITSIEIWETGVSSGLIPAWVGNIFEGFLGPPGGILLARLDERAGSLRLTPLNKDGTPSSATRSSFWPVLAQNGITRLEARFDASLSQPEDLFIVVRSGDQTLASAPIRR